MGHDGAGPWISYLRRYRFPRLLMPSIFVLPPVECWRRVSPGHAARSRPFAKALPSPTAAGSVVALAHRGTTFLNLNQIGRAIRGKLAID